MGENIFDSADILDDDDQQWGGLRCVRCRRRPDQIPEYRHAALAEGITAAEYVYEEEGTLNHATGEFACTECYIAMGQPTAPGGWTP